MSAEDRATLEAIKAEIAALPEADQQRVAHWRDRFAIAATDTHARIALTLVGAELAASDS